MTTTTQRRATCPACFATQALRGDMLVQLILPGLLTLAQVQAEQSADSLASYGPVVRVEHDCARCGSRHDGGQSCMCFDNGCE